MMNIKLRKICIDIKKILIILFIVYSLMPTLCSVGNITLKILYLVFAIYLLELLKKGKAILPRFFLNFGCNQ